MKKTWITLAALLAMISVAGANVAFARGADNVPGVEKQRGK